MAERNVVCYSFYVPEQDEQLRSFLAAQSNLSLSMRLLVKAFIANGAGSGEDISVADLGVLIRSMQLGSVAESAEMPKRGRRRVADGAGTARAQRQQVPAMQAAAAAVTASAQPAEAMPVPAAPAAAAPAPVQNGRSAAADPDPADGSAAQIAETFAEPAETADSRLPNGGAESVPEASAGAKSDLPDDSFPPADDGQDDEDFEPQVTPESGADHKDAREAYNGSMNKGIPVMDEDEDIEALMGDLS